MDPERISGGFYAPADNCDADDLPHGEPSSLSFRQDAAADALYREMCEPDAEGEF